MMSLQEFRKEYHKVKSYFVAEIHTHGSTVGKSVGYAVGVSVGAFNMHAIAAVLVPEAETLVNSSRWT